MISIVKKKNKISRKGSLKMYSSFSKKFRQIKPYDNYNVTDVPWHEAMVAGNGRLGVLESCAPIEDSLIYQNVEFVMPSEDVPYDVTAQLDEARQSVINFDDTWNIHNRKRTNMYCHHPGQQLRIEMLKVAHNDERKTLFEENKALYAELSNILVELLVNESSIHKENTKGLIWNIVEVCQECPNSVTAYDNIRVKTEKCFRNIRKEIGVKGKFYVNNYIINEFCDSKKD